MYQLYHGHLRRDQAHDPADDLCFFLSGARDTASLFYNISYDSLVDHRDGGPILHHVLAFCSLQPRSAMSWASCCRCSPLICSFSTSETYSPNLPFWNLLFSLSHGNMHWRWRRLPCSVAGLFYLGSDAFMSMTLDIRWREGDSNLGGNNDNITTTNHNKPTTRISS